MDGAFPSLEVVEVSDNSLATTSEWGSRGGLSALTHFTCINCNILYGPNYNGSDLNRRPYKANVTLPEAWNNLHKLTYLNISGCQLTGTTYCRHAC